MTKSDTRIFRRIKWVTVLKMKIKIVNLLLVILTFVLYPRLLIAIGFPKFIIFGHFIFTLVLFYLTSRKSVSHPLLRNVTRTMLLLCLAMVVSAILNEAGIINVILSFLMLASPIFLLVSMLSHVWSYESILRFERFIVLFIFIHTFLAFFQHFVLGYRHDDVEGVFIGMGAGGHLAGAVSAISAMWVFRINWLSSKFRIVIVILSVMVIALSDSKQVVAVLGVSFAIYFFMVSDNLVSKFKLVGAGVISLIGLIVIANTIFPSLLVYLQDDKILLGFIQKFTVIPITISLYDSWFSWLFGLGPGHTVSRLATMLPSYELLSSGLGATTGPATEIILSAKQDHYLSNTKTGSSMFSLDFTFAGIWGDLGIIGLALYIYVYKQVWFIIGDNNNLSKFFLISIFVYSSIFVWGEEPAFMIYIISYIGYSWQKKMNEQHEAT